MPRRISLCANLFGGVDRISAQAQPIKFFGLAFELAGNSQQ